ncbi:hypothetical protein B0H19DRAFT_1080453 [Mycena capillaripes]|nr:hypothetical protein B0H19DRAFT_1080453 [Mycena capillaripes]
MDTCIPKPYHRHLPRSVQWPATKNTLPYNLSNLWIVQRPSYILIESVDNQSPKQALHRCFIFHSRLFGTLTGADHSQFRKYLFSAAAVFSFGVASALADGFAFDLHLPSNPSKCITATGSAANSPLVISDCFNSLPTGSNPPSQSFFAIYPTSVAESGDFGSVAVNFNVGDALNKMCLTVGKFQFTLSGPDGT